METFKIYLFLSVSSCYKALQCACDQAEGIVIDHLLTFGNCLVSPHEKSLDSHPLMGNSKEERCCKAYTLEVTVYLLVEYCNRNGQVTSRCYGLLGRLTAVCFGNRIKLK